MPADAGTENLEPRTLEPWSSTHFERRLQKANLTPILNTRGATISCTRPKYDVVDRAASNAAWLAKFCVKTPKSFWLALELSTLCSSATNDARFAPPRRKPFSARSDRRLRKLAR